MEILTEIIDILGGGITGLAAKIGDGLSALVTSIFLSAEGTGLSTFGTVIVIFAGISLAIGLCRLIVRWVSTLGGSRV